MNRDTNKTFRHVKLNFFILACAKKTNMEKNTFNYGYFNCASDDNQRTSVIDR